MKIRARSQFLDLKNNFSARQLYSIIGFVFVLCFMAVMLFIWIRDWLISLTFIGCAIAGYFLFTRSPNEFDVEVTEASLIIGEYTMNITDILSWALVDLGDTLEVVIRTKNYANPYLYFYIPDNDQNSFNFIKAMRNYIFYDPQMPQQNYIHQVLRFLNLK